MISAGQTQNVQSPCLYFSPEGKTYLCDSTSCRSVSDYTGEASPSLLGSYPECVSTDQSSQRAVVNPWDAQNAQAATGTTLERIASLACNDGSDEARLQCTEGVTDAYTTNLGRVPENLKQIFEGFAEIVANTIFKLCPADPSNSLCSGSEINILGGTYAFAEFLVELADLLGGCPSRHSSVYWETHQDEYRRFLECHRAPSEESEADPICQEVHDSGYWAGHPAEMERYRHCPHDDPTSPAPPDVVPQEAEETQPATDTNPPASGGVIRSPFE